MDNNYLKLNELVRSLQRSAGDQDCFRRELGPCDRRDCPWRSLCLDQSETSDINKMRVVNHN